MRVRPATSGAPAPPPPASTSSRFAGRARTFTAVLGDRVLSTPAPPVRQPPAEARGGGPAPMRALLERTLDSERRVDTLLAAAARGKTFSPSELLALQATVFKYSQAVEVVSRAADKLVGAVKQTLGTQV